MCTHSGKHYTPLAHFTAIERCIFPFKAYALDPECLSRTHVFAGGFDLQVRSAQVTSHSEASCRVEQLHDDWVQSFVKAARHYIIDGS